MLGKVCFIIRIMLAASLSASAGVRVGARNVCSSRPHLIKVDAFGRNVTTDSFVELELLQFMSCNLSAPLAARLMPTAYDLGMNHGQTAVLYLRQGYRVVSVEANPALVASFRSKLAWAASVAWPELPERAAGLARLDERLLVLNRAIAAANASSQLSFCIEKGKDFASHVIAESSSHDHGASAGRPSCAPGNSVVSVPAASISWRRSTPHVFTSTKETPWTH